MENLQSTILNNEITLNEEEIKNSINGAVRKTITKTGIFEKIDRKKCFPIPERQSNGKFDTYGCATFNEIKPILTVLKAQLLLGRISPETKKWLEDNKYLKDGEFDVSERYTIVSSATDPNFGNSMEAVANNIDEVGLVPSWACPWNASDNKNDYYDRSKITQEAVDLGKEWVKRIKTEHEWINRNDPNYKDAWSEYSKHAVLSFAIYAWFKNSEGIYYNPKRGTSNHIIACYDLDELDISDTYIPFIKKISSRDDVLGFAMAFYAYDKNFKEENMTNVKIVKDTNSKTVYMALPVKDEKAFESYCQNYGIEIKKHGDYTIDWKQMLNGSITLN